MRFLVIQGGQVANVVEADEAFGLAQGWKPDPGGAAIGDTDNGDGTFSRPQPTVEVPKEVTRRQARRALTNAGLWSVIPQVIEQIPDEQARADALADWEESQVFRRDWPLVAMLAPALGLDEAAIDQLFIEAAKL